MTDAEGALVEETAFYPFGEARNEYRLRQIEESYKFTQKERDRESGLQYFEARFLAGRLSRFATADSKYANLNTLSPEDFGAFLRNPQKLNLYAYTLNNPSRYVDPDGKDIATPYDINPDWKHTVHKKNGNVTVTLKNGTSVTILPNTVVGRTRSGGQAETELRLGMNRNALAKTASAVWTIRTSFRSGVNPDKTQIYGRGTTPDDITDGNTSIRFHEGEHGRGFLEYLDKNAPPTFNPGNKPFTGSWTYAKARNQFAYALNQYYDKALKANLNETDCVGTKHKNCK